MLPDKLYVNRALQAMISLSIIIVGTIFILEMFSFYQNRKHFSFHSLKNRWRAPLAMGSFICLILLSIDGSYEWRDWTDTPQSCDIASGFIALLFVVLKQCVNLFLYDRAKIVHEALQLEIWWLKWLRWIIWLSVVFGVHLIFAWSYYLNFFGRVSVDGDCIFWTRYPAVIISFAVSDACLNSCMLILFAAPLYLQMKQSSEVRTKATDKVRSLMVRNMVISLCVVSLDVLALSVMAFFFITVDHTDVTQEHLVLWGNFAAAADQLVVIIGIHMMTAGWVPLGIRKRIRACYVRTFHRVADAESLTLVT